MRKFALLVALVMLISLTACANPSIDDEILSGTTSANGTGSLPTGTTSAATSAASSAATGTTAATSATDTGEVFSFSPSDGLTEAGYFEGVDALSLVTLPEYVGITLPAEVHTPTEEAIQAEIDTLMQNFEYKENLTEGVIAEGDTVNIDFVGTIDGVEFEGGNTQGAGTSITIGTTQLIDDFVEQLVGHKPGDVFDIEVTFPDDYSEESLRGKDAVFATTINYIEGQTLTPELTDAFVAENLASYYGWATVEELREGLKTNLVDSNITSYIQNYLTENSNVSSVPDSMLEYQINAMLDYYNTYASYYKMSLDDFITQVAGAEDREALIEKNRDGLEYYARYYLVTQAIAEDAGIVADDAAITAYFEENMTGADMEQYVTDYGSPYLHYVVLNELVMSYLRDNAVNQ
ncbi:MAG: FKBP-type peptidyl-prolyl cis-trans isomerase [Clostridiaceae bacterium]|nr:FKBP-type peptidyl-prolyl cis-trans isomerase [Clostridiaceae bacterium]